MGIFSVPTSEDLKLNNAAICHLRNFKTPQTKREMRASMPRGRAGGGPPALHPCFLHYKAAASTLSPFPTRSRPVAAISLPRPDPVPPHRPATPPLSHSFSHGPAGPARRRARHIDPKSLPRSVPARHRHNPSQARSPWPPRAFPVLSDSV